MKGWIELKEGVDGFAQNINCSNIAQVVKCVFSFDPPTIIELNSGEKIRTNRPYEEIIKMIEEATE